VGELARMFNEEKQIGAALTVIPIQGWERSFYFDQTGLPWINPSPNMRSLNEAVLYPGVGLLETTALSVGRGTDTPFEMVGAPYIDDLEMAAHLNNAELQGVRFVPVRFTPTASVFKGQSCKGVNIVVIDRDKVNVVDIGLIIASYLQRTHPKEFGLEKFNRLLVHSPTVQAIRDTKELPQIRSLWQAKLNDFRTRREKYLLYK
jgi:uncharacterized protein YbbC (DUF1343 family)